ncbi:MAG: hypothetical protein AABO41_14750 [Acidobacteriota bacterium]
MKGKHPAKPFGPNEPLSRREASAQAQRDKLEGIQANRILEEWKANVQLYVHHDNLKQERIRHFLTMQGALFAFVGLSTKEAIEGTRPILATITFLLFSIGISVIGVLLAFGWKGMDERARKFTLFERRCLRELENEWRSLFPKDRRGLSTYTELAVILEKGGETFQNIDGDRCRDIKQTYHGDYKALEDQSGTASSMETLIWFKVILLFWIASSAGHIALLISFLVVRHF